MGRAIYSFCWKYPPRPYLGLPSHKRGFRGLDGGVLSLYSPLPTTKCCFLNFNLGNPLQQHTITPQLAVWIHLLNNLTLDHFGWRLVNVLVNPSYNHDRINNLIEKLMIFKLIIIIIQGPQKGCGDMWMLLGAIPCQLLEAVHLLLSST